MKQRSPAKRGNPLGDRAPWVCLPAVPNLRDAHGEDAELLRRVLSIETLAAEHPIRIWWDARTVGSRFHLHHLADDLRRIEGVDGAKSLIRQLRNNPTGFADFRFELHLAGALARSSGQRLLRLGGDKSGPDVEAQIKSGQRCGFACFRAASSSPAIVKLRTALRDLVRQLTPTVLARATVSQTIVVDMSEFPLPPNHVTPIRSTLRTFLAETDKGELKGPGCHLFRLQAPPVTSATQSRIVRLRLQVAVLDWERERVYRTLSEKVSRECSTWANAYQGVPIFAMEESMFGQNTDGVLARLMGEENAFVGILATYLTVRPDAVGIPNGLEDVSFVFRPNTSDVNLGLETFGDNVASWTEGFAHATQIPASLREEWDVITTGIGSTFSLVRPAALDRLYARVPYTDPSKPTKDEATVQRLIDAAMQLLEWQKAVY